MSHLRGSDGTFICDHEEPHASDGPSLRLVEVGDREQPSL